MSITFAQTLKVVEVLTSSKPHMLLAVINICRYSYFSLTLTSNQFSILQFNFVFLKFINTEFLKNLSILIYYSEIMIIS